MLLKYICKKHLNAFDDILRLNSYPENSIEQTKRPQIPQRNPQPANPEWSYLKIPYISQRLNHRFTNILRKENIPVRIAHKSYTFRQALSHTSTECKFYSCQNKDYKGIDVKIIMRENDPANLPLYEAFYIRKYKPTLKVAYYSFDGLQQLNF